MSARRARRASWAGLGKIRRIVWAAIGPIRRIGSARVAVINVSIGAAAGALAIRLVAVGLTGDVIGRCWLVGRTLVNDLNRAAGGLHEAIAKQARPVVMLGGLA